MSKVICIMGESGSGKTTSMRNLDPKSTYYIDADKKGLSWKGWRKQYNKENKNYLACDDANIVRQYIKRIAEACPGVKEKLWFGRKTLHRSIEKHWQGRTAADAERISERA